MPPLPHTAGQLLRQLADGASVADLLRDHPGLAPEEIRSILLQAAALVDAATVPPADPAATVDFLAPNGGATLPPSQSAETTETIPPGEVIVADLDEPVSIPGYAVVSELGRGGMGVVYFARQLGLNRPVALKMILAGRHAGAAAVARFRAEAMAVARLQHPGVVQVYEVGEHDGNPFFSLEYVAGGNLESRLTAEPWRAEAAAELVEKLARAVHAAHGAGVVHRDLKPANVLLAYDGTPKITDFGLAKQLEGGAGQTRTGEVMGTPEYMAPEQAAGQVKAIGPATDVWALGAILYRLLAGRPAFRAASSLDTILLVLESEPPPLRKLNTRVPRPLAAVCGKCLEKNPARRYATAAELADDLRRFLEGEPVKARPSRLRRGLSWAWKHPGLCLARGVASLAVMAAAVGPLFTPARTAFFAAVCLIAVPAGAGLVRTRAKPLLIGVAVTLAAEAAALILALIWDVIAVRWAVRLDEKLLTVEGASAAGLLAVAVGVVSGLRGQMRRVALGTIAILGAAALGPVGHGESWLTEPPGLLYLQALLSGLGCGFVLGVAVKLVVAATGGRALDAAAGAITGGLCGFVVSAMCSGVLLMIPLAGRARDPSGAMWVMAVTSGLMIVGGLGGFIGGAFLGALGSRPKRPHGTEPGPA